jgi:hypothetical protein
MANRHTGGRNPAGYICPKRKERRVINIYVEPDLAVAMRELTAIDGKTVQDTGEKLFQKFVQERVRDRVYKHPISAIKPPLNPSSNDGDVVIGPAPEQKSVRPNLDDWEQENLPRTNGLPIPRSH